LGPGLEYLATVLLPLAILLFTLVAFSAASSRRSRDTRLARLRADWGTPRDRERDLAGIAEFFRAEPATDQSLDDRTWDDLLLDDVFSWIDRGESRLGQQLLYRRLRGAAHPSLDAFEALLGRMADVPSVRERAQLALHELRDASVYHLHRLARPRALERAGWHVFFPLWTALVLCLLVSAFFSPRLLLVIVPAFVINIGIRGSTGPRVSREIVSFRQIGPLLSAARALVPVGTADTAAITGELARDLDDLRRLRTIARWVSRDATSIGGDILASVLEYLNLLLLMDVNALFFAGRELQARGPQLLRVIATVGEIDAAIAVASWRTGEPRWTRPNVVPADATAVFEDVTHPLIEEAVPNSLTAAPPHGVLITGSNMSGKSTFLRTIGINVVLAQTVNTALARRYEAPVYRVRSCIGRSDDLISGKSYYLVEVESVLALVHAAARREPHLFIFDELFRGTNAVERIAAAEAVLDALVADGRPHIALAATHDGELVDLLKDHYVVYHLGDAVGPDGLVFDYRLTAGPATSRNAITLLRLNGAPESLVTQALARAAALDRRPGLSPGTSVQEN
jgi:hypothetical protein